MKVLYILRTSFGLMGTNASYFIPREVSKSHEVMVLEGPSYEAEDGLIVTSHDGLNIKRVNETDFKKRLTGICAHIDEFKPDIIHLFYHHQALRLGKALRGKYGRKIKLLLDIRTPLLEERLKQRVRVQARAMLLQNAFDMIATHSSYSVKTIFPFCWLPVRELSYGVDISAFKVRKTAWKKNNIDLVYTGAIAKKRQIEQLLLGFKTLVDSHEALQYNFMLHLYGSGNRIDEMRALVNNLEMEKNVIFHGLVNQKKLSQTLQKHAIGIGYVPFGVYKQSPALKTIEYMCAGLSVLASNTQPTKDLLKLGFKLETYDNSPQGFTNCVLKICEQGWEEASVSNNLRLLRQFDWQHIVENSLIPMYQELIRE